VSASPQEYYTVKQTSKILGYSTNSIYKFLDSGRLVASRGQSEQGRFRIPKKSLDDFFGATIPQSYINERLTPAKPKKVTRPVTQGLDPNQHVLSGPAAPHTPPINLKLARILILISLCIIIADVLVSRDFSLLPQLFRLVLIGILVYITYQFESSQTPSENHPVTSYPSGQYQSRVQT
jgi:hypothetical protein